MKRVTLSIKELRDLFISGGIFERENIEYDMGERDEINALDFGEYMKEVLNIDINLEE